MKTITIEVTQEDIDKGKAGECRRCPIARAISRITSFTVEVYYTSVCFCNDVGDKYRSELPSIAQDFIESFDNGGPIRPFTFTLEVPQ